MHQIPEDSLLQLMTLPSVFAGHAKLLAPAAQTYPFVPMILASPTPDVESACLATPHTQKDPR